MAPDRDRFEAPGPPKDLAIRSLPLVTVPRDAVWYRVHRSAQGPLHFGPRNPPDNRFDDPAGRFGTLYLGATLEVAFVETLLRNPALRVVSMAEVAARRWVAVRAGRDLRLVDFCGPGLSAVGTTGGVNTGPHRVSRAWAAALHAHPDTPDGITYWSRHDPSLRCGAFFDRPGLTVSASDGRPFDLAWLAATLRAYGKVLTT